MSYRNSQAALMGCNVACVELHNDFNSHTFCNAKFQACFPINLLR